MVRRLGRDNARLPLLQRCHGGVLQECGVVGRTATSGLTRKRLCVPATATTALWAGGDTKMRRCCICADDGAGMCVDAALKDGQWRAAWRRLASTFSTVPPPPAAGYLTCSTCMPACCLPHLSPLSSRLAKGRRPGALGAVCRRDGVRPGRRMKDALAYRTCGIPLDVQRLFHRGWCRPASAEEQALRTAFCAMRLLSGGSSGKTAITGLPKAASVEEGRSSIGDGRFAFGAGRQAAGAGKKRCPCAAFALPLTFTTTSTSILGFRNSASGIRPLLLRWRVGIYSLCSSRGTWRRQLLAILYGALYGRPYLPFRATLLPRTKTATP